MTGICVVSFLPLTGWAGVRSRRRAATPGRIVMQTRSMRSCVVLASALVVGLAWTSIAKADDHEHVRGVINARGDNGTVSVRVDDGSDVVVAIKDFTRVLQRDGAREKKVTSSSLVPGLRID